jgi:hypothetical protein
MPFTLINPYINNLNFSSSKKSADLAAEDIWNKFSKNITEYVPNFNFTVKNNSDNSLYHYNVKENLENENVKYTISNLSGSNKYDKELLADFNNSKKMKGGKKRYDSSSSSSSFSSSSSSSDTDKFTFKSNKSSVLLIDPVLTYNPLYTVPITSSSLWLPKVVVNTPMVGVGITTVPTVATIRLNGLSFLIN